MRQLWSAAIVPEVSASADRVDHADRADRVETLTALTRLRERCLSCRWLHSRMASQQITNLFSADAPTETNWIRTDRKHERAFDDMAWIGLFWIHFQLYRLQTGIQWRMQ